MRLNSSCITAIASIGMLDHCDAGCMEAVHSQLDSICDKFIKPQLWIPTRLCHAQRAGAGQAANGLHSQGANPQIGMDIRPLPVNTLKLTCSGDNSNAAATADCRLLCTIGARRSQSTRLRTGLCSRPLMYKWSQRCRSDKKVLVPTTPYLINCKHASRSKAFHHMCCLSANVSVACDRLLPLHAALSASS